MKTVAVQPRRCASERKSLNSIPIEVNPLLLQLSMPLEAPETNGYGGGASRAAGPKFEMQRKTRSARLGVLNEACILSCYGRVGCLSTAGCNATGVHLNAP